MRRFLFVLTSALLLFGFTSSPAHADEAVFSSNLRGNIADQVIAGFPSSRATWDIRRGRITLVGFGEHRVILVAQAKGLIIPSIGFNPSPDFLARVVCHDEAGRSSEAARTRTAPLSQGGNGTLIDVVELPAACFAPIVLITGSTDPAGNRPGNWFAVSAF
jgi:hypothetical protein